MEFVVGMLTQLGVLSWNDVQPFLDQFDAFDKDRSGHLDANDIAEMVRCSSGEQRKSTCSSLRSTTRRIITQRRILPPSPKHQPASQGQED